MSGAVDPKSSEMTPTGSMKEGRGVILFGKSAIEEGREASNFPHFNSMVIMVKGGGANYDY
jgi:hypothetical protein